MTEYDQKATIEGESLEKMRHDADIVLQKLLKNMVEKSTNEGTMTIKIDVSFIQEFVPIPRDQQTEKTGQTRRVLKPQFEHKISSTMQIKGEAKGKNENETMELVWDEETGSYILTPVTGNQQMSIYDMMAENAKEDIRNGNADDGQEGQDDVSQKQVEGRRFIALPEPEAEVEGGTDDRTHGDGNDNAADSPEKPGNDSDDVIDGEYREVDADDSSDDIEPPESDDIELDFPEDDAKIGGYEYQEPGDGQDDDGGQEGTEELIDDEEEVEASWQ